MTKSIAVILVGLVLSVHAVAQTTYRSTMPDGRVIYSDKPIPGAAKTVETAPPMPTSGIGGTVLRMPNNQERGSNNQERPSNSDGPSSSSRPKGETTRVSVEAAEEALRKAEQARRQGADPGEGDRTGIAGRGSRLNESYFERQGKLEEEVEKAKQALEKARSQQ